MSLDELLAQLQKLNRADKQHVLEFLQIELAKEDDTLLESSADYPIWSPIYAFEAAEKLIEMTTQISSNKAQFGSTNRLRSLRLAILVSYILVILAIILILSFSVVDPAPAYYYETGTAIESTNNWVDTAVAATMTAKVK